MALGAVGAMALAWERTAEFARERQAFGRPLSGHQAIRHKLADLATSVYTCRCVTYDALRRFVAGEEPLQGGHDGQAAHPARLLRADGRLPADPRRRRLHARVLGRARRARRPPRARSAAAATRSCARSSGACSRSEQGRRAVAAAHARLQFMMASGRERLSARCAQRPLLDSLATCDACRCGPSGTSASRSRRRTCALTRSAAPALAGRSARRDALGSRHARHAVQPAAASTAALDATGGHCRAHGPTRGAPHRAAACTRLRPDRRRTCDAIRCARRCAWSTANAPRHGEAALRPNTRLRRAAQGHSESMARRRLLRTRRARAARRR